MKYEHITEGRFIDRPNRFIARLNRAVPDTFVTIFTTDFFKLKD